MRLRRVLRGTVVIAASAAAVLALSASPAAASQHLVDIYPNNCSQVVLDPDGPRPFDVYTTVPGGEVSGLVYVARLSAGYEVCATGWVMDTRADSKGAILYATYDWYDNGTWRNVPRDRLTRADGYTAQEYYSWASFATRQLRNFYVGVCHIADGIVSDCREESH